MKPILQANAGIYILTWQDPPVRMRLDRFWENRDRKPSCELTIESTAPGMEGHLLHDSLTLTSARARASIARLLASKGPPELDWAVMLEQACLMVLEDYRKGEPIADLLAEPPSQDTEPYSIYPIMRKGVATLLYGAPGVGKGLVACALSAWRADGREACGMRPVLGNVLYMDWEASKRDVQERIWRIRNPYVAERGAQTVYYRFCAQVLSAELPEIQREVLEHEIDCIVIDSAAPACGHPQEDPAVTALFNGLRSLRRARGAMPVDALIIGHQPKNTPDKTPFGSTFWEARPRDVWWVNGVQTGSRQTVSLQHYKNNDGPKTPPFGLEFTFQENEIAVKRVDAGAEPELEAKLSLPNRIASVLRHSPMYPKELMEALGLKDDPALFRDLGRGKDRRFVKIVEGEHKGKWALIARPAASVPNQEES